MLVKSILSSVYTSTPCVDLEGNKYPNIVTMCNELGLDVYEFRFRRVKHMPIPLCFDPTPLSELQESGKYGDLRRYVGLAYRFD